MDIEDLRMWIGRTVTVSDMVTPVPLIALAATLDRDDAVPVRGDAVAPCWHWLYFLHVYRHSDTDVDGHLMRGGFLPPVPLPRRMWAAGRIEFLSLARVGQSISRTSRILDVSFKEGRTGPLVFVKVQHRVLADGELAILEEQNIVYRGLPTSVEPEPPGISEVGEFSWSREVLPDEVLLFRYSALTFNSHRIHYDRPYATQVEGYPGLVVHGPLIATLLLDLLRREIPAAQVLKFAFKAMKPIFDTAPFQIYGRLEGDKTVKLWAVTPEGYLAMDATAEIA